MDNAPATHDNVVFQLEVLAKENAALRAQLSLTGSDKLLQHAFAAGASQLQQEFAAAPVCHSDDSELQTNSSLVALQEQCKQNIALSQKISQLDNEVLGPLKSELQRLTSENESLKLENTMLREGETSQTLLLERRLHDSVESEKSLQTDFALFRSRGNAAAQFVGATLQRLVDAVELFRSDIVVAGDKAGVVAALERQIQQILAAHAESLNAVVNDSALEATSEKARADFLQAALDDAKSQSLQHSEALKSLVCENQSLQDRVAALEAEERSFNIPSYQELKRRRLETDATAERFNDRRRELIEFWFDGHERIELLSHELQSAAPLAEELNCVRAELLAQKRDRAISVSSVVALSEEVERLREELIQSRSRSLGLECENDILIRELSKLLASQMEVDELVAVAHAIRLAGEQAAAATTQAVVDPIALQEAIQRSHEIRQEISQLSHRRDEVLQCIQLREARLASLDAMVSQSVSEERIENTCDTSLLCELESLRSELLACESGKLSFARDVTNALAGIRKLLDVSEAQKVLLENQIAASQMVARSAASIASQSSAVACEQLEVFERQHRTLNSLIETTTSQATSVTQEATPVTTDFETICTTLGDHLQLMRETVEIESRQHSIHETEYILALLEELNEKEAALSNAKKHYNSELETLHVRLASQIDAIKNSWSTSIGQTLTVAQSDLMKLEHRLLSLNTAIATQPRQIHIPQESDIILPSGWQQRASTIADATAQLAAAQT